MDERLKSFYKGFRLNKDVLYLIDKVIHRERLMKVHNHLRRVLKDPTLLPYERYQDSMLRKKRVKLFNPDTSKLEDSTYVWERVPLNYMKTHPNFIVLDNIFSYDYVSSENGKDDNCMGYFYVWKEMTHKRLIRRKCKCMETLTRYQMYVRMYEHLCYITSRGEINYRIYGMDNIVEALGYQW
jgi:hypothetical protein